MNWPLKKNAGHERQWLLGVDAERVRLRRKRAVTLDWQVSPDEAAWQAAVAGTTAFADGDIEREPNRTQMQSLGVLAVLLMVLIGGVAYLWQMGEAGAQRIEGELRAAVEADQWLDLAGDVDPAVMSAGIGPVTVERITFKPGVVSAEVKRTQTDAQGQPYVVRQHQFYRPTQAGWERVPPDAELLGPRQTLTRGQLTFHYHAIDATAVETVAAPLNAAYVDLRRDYGLTAAPHPVTVDLTAAEQPYRDGCFWHERLCVASPALTPLPSFVAESEALSLWTLRALAAHARGEALQDPPLRPGWQFTSSGLTALQVRRHSERLAAWHGDLARWLYGIEGRTPPPDADQLAQELVELCRTHQVTAYPSFFAGITHTHLCTRPPIWDLKRLLRIPAPQRLDALHMPDVDLTGAAPSWLQELAFGTLLDYVTATYGREGIAGLIEGFRQYDTWHALVPAVFGVSAAEFEQGWQAYLRALQ